MTDRVKKIEEQLSSIGHLARSIESEAKHANILADVLLRRLVAPGEVLQITQEEWTQAMNHPMLETEHNEKDYTDWSWYVSLKSQETHEEEG